VSQCDRLSTELRRHQRTASDADRRKAEWRSVALVLDRLLLIAFFVVTCPARWSTVIVSILFFKAESDKGNDTS